MSCLALFWSYDDSSFDSSLFHLAFMGTHIYSTGLRTQEYGGVKTMVMFFRLKYSFMWFEW